MGHDIQDRLKAIYGMAGKEDWSEDTFSARKAAVCAELSALAYCDIREHELKRASRIHLAASSEYARGVKDGRSHDLEPIIRRTEFGEGAFVLRGRYSVVLGLPVGRVLFLVIRGTVLLRLWDWRANVDVRKYYVREGNHLRASDHFYHRGFFEAIVPHFQSIGERIGRLSEGPERPALVWTGHSLGGAMAAIGHAVGSVPRSSHWGTSFFASSDAYTFGMPRYAGLGPIVEEPGPHHIFNPRDVVPTLPPRRARFSDSAREYVLAETGDLAPGERTDTFGALGHLFRPWRSLRAHAIEGYADALALNTGCARPGT